MKKVILTLPLAVLLGSCCTPPESNACKIPQHRLVSQNNPDYGWQSSKNTLDAVRDSPVVKGYAIKAYVDPNNPDVRMPGGTMHVITRPSRWNTEPLTRNGIVVEPQYASVNHNVPAQVEQSRLAQLESKASKTNMMAKDAALQSRMSERKIEALEAKVKELEEGR